MTITRWLRGIALLAFALLAPLLPARAAEPIRIGLSIALTGGTAAIGKQILVGLQIWRDDVNEKGGLLGRPVALVYYDDQSSPAQIPGIYAKLLDIDKVDLLIGPYATNLVTPALPVIMQHNMTTIGILANAANSQFHYNRYFSMIPSGPEPKSAFSTGLFELARLQNPAPKTLAIIGADAEFARNATDGARENAPKYGLRIVFDKSYPPSNTDFAPMMRAVQAADADIVFAAAYPPDSVGIVRAANEIGLKAKIFGGPLIGLLPTSAKMQLGPLMNGIVITQSFTVTRAMDYPGLRNLVKRYQDIAPAQGIDPLGYQFPPFGYGSAQVLEAAVTETRSLDHGKLAEYMRSHVFHTVLGDIEFGADGEWTKPRMMFTQFRGVTPNDLEQFRTVAHEIVLWPPDIKTGTLSYPYTDAKK